MIQTEPYTYPYHSHSDAEPHLLRNPDIYQPGLKAFAKIPTEDEYRLDRPQHEAEVPIERSDLSDHNTPSSIDAHYTTQVNKLEELVPNEEGDVLPHALPDIVRSRRTDHWPSRNGSPNGLQEPDMTGSIIGSTGHKRKRGSMGAHSPSLEIANFSGSYVDKNIGIGHPAPALASEQPMSMQKPEDMLFSPSPTSTATHAPESLSQAAEPMGSLGIKPFREHEQFQVPDARLHPGTSGPHARPAMSTRAISHPFPARRPQSPHRQQNPRHTVGSSQKEVLEGLRLELPDKNAPAHIKLPEFSPMPAAVPWPPLSIPAYLQLELSSHSSRHRMHRSAEHDVPYESSRVKIERLLNFLLLPPHLEGVLWFGALACFDAWLYTFTILPLRLLRSFYILSQSWVSNVAAEVQYLSIFIYNGTGRVWQRQRTRAASASQPDTLAQPPGQRHTVQEPVAAHKSRHHRRTKSAPSTLLPDDKADILKGLLIICTCLILLRLDASRMYHWIRGQAAIKLYVIYNVLEVCDRLFSAIGQDVLECLFSRESLERKPEGHSKLLRPLWLFGLALIYTTIHATALFYQVITLNVAVNSYSNALITLLMSNQFVEIKSTVFKKFEKENLFQLTCADVVERFQLWLMLTIIASRNIVETGGLSIGMNALHHPALSVTTASINASQSSTAVQPPLFASTFLPRSFTLIPSLLSSLTLYVPAVGHVLGPFLVVLGSEMLVDWLKHAYINKFNNVRPAIYGRFLDVLAQDYYSHAFAEQNLTKRLGLPVIPLSCLFIRASAQTYHMFMAGWAPMHKPSSSPTLASIHEQYTASRETIPTSTVAALSYSFDDFMRQIPEVITTSRVFANFTTVLAVLLAFLVLLALKLVLGMLLLFFSRSRYMSMKQHEKRQGYQVEGGKRVGGWGVVEVDEAKRRWIYEDDPDGLRSLKEREQKAKLKPGAYEDFDKVRRYEMAAKRIW